MKEMATEANKSTRVAVQREEPELLKPYSLALYEGMNLNWLVVAVSAVEESGIALSFEHVVVAAFRLFPKKFSLLGLS